MLARFALSGSQSHPPPLKNPRSANSVYVATRDTKVGIYRLSARHYASAGTIAFALCLSVCHKSVFYQRDERNNLVLA